MAEEMMMAPRRLTVDLALAEPVQQIADALRGFLNLCDLMVEGVDVDHFKGRARIGLAFYPDGTTYAHVGNAVATMIDALAGEEYMIYLDDRSAVSMLNEAYFGAAEWTY